MEMPLLQGDGKAWLKMMKKISNFKAMLLLQFFSPIG